MTDAELEAERHFLDTGLDLQELVDCAWRNATGRN